LLVLLPTELGEAGRVSKGRPVPVLADRRQSLIFLVLIITNLLNRAHGGVVMLYLLAALLLFFSLLNIWE